MELCSLQSTEQCWHFKRKRKLRQNVINWISRAWENISEPTIIDTFLSCDISNNLDGTGDRVSEKFPSLDEDDLRGELGDLLFDSETDSELDLTRLVKMISR